MGGRNAGIFHSCRAKTHFFNDCPRKRPCQLCGGRFEKCFVVERESGNKGKLFVCCSNNCGFWSWVVTENSSSASSSVDATVVNHTKNERVDEMSRMFESRLRLTDEDELKISVDVTIRMEKVSAIVNAIEKRPS